MKKQTDRQTQMIYAKDKEHLEKVIDKLNEYLFDVKCEIISKCKCGRIIAVAHYIV